MLKLKNKIIDLFRSLCVAKCLLIAIAKAVKLKLVEYQFVEQNCRAKFVEYNEARKFFPQLR